MTYQTPPGGVPPTYVMGVPGGGTYPLVYNKQFNPQKNSGKNFMRIIRPPHIPYYYYMDEIQLTPYYIYRGETIFAYIYLYLHCVKSELKPMNMQRTFI